MAKQDYSLQITFHYNNGEKESFLVTETAEENDPYPELPKLSNKGSIRIGVRYIPPMKPFILI
ncbi:MAG: hypothetical protein ACOC0N_10380 [Chroococcales cyanobacterium]